jgi:hypothetical protein
MGFVVAEVALSQVFLRVLRFHPASITQPIDPYSSSSSNRLKTDRQRAKPGVLHKDLTWFRKSGKIKIEKNFNYFALVSEVLRQIYHAVKLLSQAQNTLLINFTLHTKTQ